MDTRILEIKTLENKIKNINSAIDFHYISLGNYLVMSESDENSALIEKNKLSSDLKDLKVIFFSYDEATKKKEKINNNKELISKIELKTKDTLKRISDLEKENNKHYIGIAETLYELYKIDPQKIPEIEPYFSELLAIDNKNREISEKIKEIESDKKASFFGSLKDIGEKTILNTKKRYNYSLMLSYFKTAGEKMCMDKIFENLDDSDIEVLFVPYKNNLKLGGELSSDLEKLNTEKNDFRMENEKIMQEFSFDANSFIKELKAKKDSAIKDFGKKLFDIVNESEKDNETPASNGSEINRLIDEIRVLNIEKDELDKKMEQVNLEIEIDKTEKDISNYKTSIEKKNQRIDELSEEIEEYINIINVSETQLDELRKKIVKQV
ncbi:MAG: hypothetical protein FWE72_02580 [Spirochaetaceae bacterium]|nr:hypothetical protein [Spirochaetaceae bacterium]